jgi:hypothetical protein
MYKYLVFFLVVSQFVACSGSKEKEPTSSKESLKAQIQEMDDSLKVWYKLVMDGKESSVPSLVIYETVNRHLDFYRAFPEDDFSATCLDKVHQLYMQEKVYELSIAYADTLLMKYPKYPNKAEVLLSLGSTYDVVLNDSTKVRLYYTRLLKEHPSMDKEVRDQVSFRLKHLNKTFDEMIDLQIQNLSKK